MGLLQCGSPQFGPDPLFAATHASAMEREKDYVKFGRHSRS
jgi:hypothetical protein